MKRITVLTVFLACGLLATRTPLFAQAAAQSGAAPAKTPDWFTGEASLLLQGRDDVASSKFEEYRVVPKGAAMPVFNLTGSHNGNGYALYGKNIYQADQRYSGKASLNWLGVAFDYNQIPHNMGNDAKTIHTETAPGVWSMNATTRKALADAIDAVPAANRTYPFYADLLGPTIAAAEHSNMSALRKRGDLAVNVGKKLPFDLAFTYNSDVKTGYRGASAGDILGVVTASVDVLEPLNEWTQDYGIRVNWNLKDNKGNVHASINRNTYDDRIDSLVVDNPFRATDLAYVSTSVPGGPARARFSTAPDNEATRGAFGTQLKFGKQTRLNADVAYGWWTQNAAFLPYTINSAITTPAGVPANTTAALQHPSLNGKIDTASYNVTFVTRPSEDLTFRAKYRNYGYKDKSGRFVITGDTSGSPDRSWTPANAPTPEEPFGHATANKVNSTIGNFEAQVSYDMGDLTIEGMYRNNRTSWEGRVESSGDKGNENVYSAAAIYHSKDWLDLRFHFDDANRTVEGIEAGTVAALQGVMADHSERDQTRIGANVDVTPNDKIGMSFGYNRKNDNYPNRPFKVAGNAATESGLLEATYDMYSADVNFTPSVRTELTGFYSYEKVAEVNQWVTLSGTALNNLLRYAPWDKGNTFGINGVFQLVPDKWKLSFLAQQQDVDGFLDITANESGAFYAGRVTLIPPGQGGAADISDYDDTRLTTVKADLGYAFARTWNFSFGYWYEKYVYADAFSDGTTIFPQAVLFYLKSNRGNYTANVAYATLTYKF